MRIFVKAKTRARTESIEAIDESHFVIAVKATPVDGKANDAIIRALADYFGVSREDVVFSSGRRGKYKVFAIKKS